jgi:hypothetical protein
MQIVVAIAYWNAAEICIRAEVSNYCTLLGVPCHPRLQAT